MNLPPGMSQRGIATLLLLVAAAALSGWALWNQRSKDQALAVPAGRADYVLVDFELVALDEQGKRVVHPARAAPGARPQCQDARHRHTAVPDPAAGRARGASLGKCARRPAGSARRARNCVFAATSRRSAPAPTAPIDAGQR